MWSTLAEWSTYAVFLGAGAGQTTTELACLATPANSELFGFVAFGGFFNLLRWELLTSGADLGATGFAALTPVSLAPSLFFSSADLAASLANPMAFLDLTLVAAAFQRAAAWESAALLHAQEVTSWTLTNPLNLHFFALSDWTLLVAELLLFLVLALRLARVSAITRLVSQFYDDLVTFCQQNGLSVTELATVLSLSLGFIFFDLFFAFGEEDLADVVSYGILLFVFITGLGLFLALDVFYYFMISGVGASSATARVVATDVVNNGLCLLRVFFCWTRYIFYDLQTELVDFTLQYTDVANETGVAPFAGATLEWTAAGVDRGAQTVWLSGASLVWAVLTVFFDLVLMVTQALISFFKLAIAFFLLWLIVDLFLLRTLAFAESCGLAYLRSR